MLRGLGFRADDVDMLIEENRRTALGFFDEGVSTPAKPKKAPEKEPVTVVEETVEEEATELKRRRRSDEPKSLMEEVGVEETVVQEEPKNATALRRRRSPSSLRGCGEEARLARGAAGRAIDDRGIATRGVLRGRRARRGAAGCK